MDAILRALAVYILLMVMFRIAGRRTMMQLTSFDLVLLLIVSEATQNAMIGNDYSVTNGLLVIVTLIGLDIGFSHLKHRSPFFERWLDGVPMVIVDNGRPLFELMNQARVDEDDIMTSARSSGLERMEQIKYAVLESSGGISIIPK
ncbi:MAG TPA: YetF domain-containing protein [Nitrospira sp.]|nr:YetF domain-containing protein [Nitrospira sp.]